MSSPAIEQSKAPLKPPQNHAFYQTESNLRTYSTKILSVSDVASLPLPSQALFKGFSPEKDVVVITDETIFHAQGGGQPSDVGSMALLPRLSAESDGVEEEKRRLIVSSARKGEDGWIMHLGRFEPPLSPDHEGAENWKRGVDIEQHIDSATRDLHSRLHTGGHLLGLAVRQVVGSSIPDFAETKASHVPGAAAVEFQGLVGEEFKVRIQARCDELVAMALVVRTCWFNEQEMEDHGVVTDGGFKVGVEGTSRVVEIGEFGGYPCGGTHVNHTGEIGKVVVKKIARKKGGTKISYDVV